MNQGIKMMTTYNGTITSAIMILMLATSCSGFPISQKNASPLARKNSLALDAERQPWNIFQFAQQSSRFVNPFPKKTQERVIEPGDVLWKAGITNDFNFAPLDDVVMGGASSSNFDATTGQWIGKVTDANNGGFIGIRSTPFVNWDMSQCQGIEVQLTTRNKSKGLRIKVVLRDSTEFNGISWTTSTNVGDKSRVKIPFAKQVPTIFAKTVPGETFSKENVKGMQFVYSKFEYDGALNSKFSLGDFQLQVEEVRAY